MSVWSFEKKFCIKSHFGESLYLSENIVTGENLDAVTAVTDSFKKADAFAGDRTGGAVAQLTLER